MATTTLHPAATSYRSGLYDWVTTTDHKKIGILYVINSFIFFFLGGILALAVRSELAMPGMQFLTAAGYNESFTMRAAAVCTELFRRRTCAGQPRKRAKEFHRLGRL